MSFKPTVFVQGEWAQNGLVFATKEEAQLSASDLMSRWMLVEDAGFVEVDDVPNYRIINGVLECIQ